MLYSSMFVRINIRKGVGLETCAFLFALYPSHYHKPMKYTILLFFTLLLFSCHTGSGDFQLCGLGIVKPYYVTRLDYKGEIYSIDKAFEKDFISPKVNNNGIAKIRFHVNCKGETGNFIYEEYDTDYQTAELNDSIEVQITAITKKLNNWIPGIDDEGEPVNSFKFLSFRIENGVITELMPK